MIKSAFAVVMAVFLSVVTFFAPPAFADANDDVNDAAGVITGFAPMPMMCGTISVNPVFVTNFTDEWQTGSFNINPGLTNEAEFFWTLEDVEGTRFGSCTARGFGAANSSSTPAQTNNITVAPGETFVGYLAMGGQDYNLLTTNSNIAMGGLPNGTENASWYDFWLDLGDDLGFKSLTLNYSNTGGAGNNGQNGFNVAEVDTSVNSDGTFNYTVTQTTLSPYSSKNTNGSLAGNWQPVVFGQNEPIGLAWIP